MAKDQINIRTKRRIEIKGGGPWPAGAMITTTADELKASEVPADAYEVVTTPAKPAPAATPSAIPKK